MGGGEGAVVGRGFLIPLITVESSQELKISPGSLAADRDDSGPGETYGLTRSKPGRRLASAGGIYCSLLVHVDDRRPRVDGGSSPRRQPKGAADDDDNVEDIKSIADDDDDDDDLKVVFSDREHLRQTPASHHPDRLSSRGIPPTFGLVSSLEPREPRRRVSICCSTGRRDSLATSTMTVETRLAPRMDQAKKDRKQQQRQERRQDKKAAKTLSAILLAFIVTWTPYNVFTVIQTFFPNCLNPTVYAVGQCI